MFSFGLLGKLLAYLAIAAGILTVIFTNQVTTLSFLTSEGTHKRILAAVAIAIIVPVFAFVYGTFTKKHPEANSNRITEGLSIRMNRV